MPSDWANPGLDLHLALDGRSGRRQAIETGLRDAIRQGRLHAGARLPATRALAADLGVARGTVAEAYAQLVAEGFLSARQGAGTTVAATAPKTPPPARPAAAAPLPPPPRGDLRVGRADAASFPRSAWLRALRRALRDAPAAALDGGEVGGQKALREALAAYLGRARGVVTSADRIVVTTGFTQAAGLLFEALAGRGRRIGLEDPCIPDFRAIAARAGLDVTPLAVDGDGARLEASRDDLAAVLVTPAHQFPLGGTLAADRRAALVEWARERDAYVIEDDYDGEFRYDRQPVGALQGLDPERVVYAGTASKTLAPGVRVGWLALPEALVEPVTSAKELADRTTSALEQLALAELIASGGFDSHLRRMRARYRRRRDALLQLVAERAPQVRPLGIAAGLHVVLQLPDDGPREAELLRRAERRGLALMPLSPFWHDPAGRPEGLIAGYGAAPEHAFGQALEALGDVIG